MNTVLSTIRLASRFTLSFILFSAFFGLISITKASAVTTLNPDPGNSIPADLRDSLRNCDTSGRSPAILYWVSQPGNPNQRQVSVPYGAASIDLDINVAAAVCYTNSAVYETNTRIVGSNSPSITRGLNSQLYVNYTNFFGPGQFNVPGTYRQAVTRITFTPPGGFTRSGVYDLGVVAKSVNNFRNTTYACVNNVGGNFPAANINDFSRCPDIPLPSAVNINVLNLEGNFDALGCDAAAGWAFDRDNTSASVDIHLYRNRSLDGRNIGPTRELRQDVNDTYRITGNHGFFWSLPEAWKDGQTVSIEAFAINLPGTSGENRSIGSLQYPTNCNSNWDVGVDVTCDVQSGLIRFRVTQSGSIPGSVTVTRNASLTNPSQGIPMPAPGGSFTLNNASFGAGNTWVQEVNFTADVGQSVNSSISVSPGGSGSLNNSSNNSANCTDGPKVARPYFRVYGGDVVVGRPFDTGGSCSKNASAGIRAYANASNGGSGVQFAASAAAAISGFLSGSMRGNAPSPPGGLTLGNVGSPLGRDGAGYTGCIPNYIQFVQDNGAVFNPASIPSQGGYYLYNGDITINSDVALSENWATNAPQLYIVVNGNINIAPGVRRLDGIYVAQGGTINTCAGAFSLCDDNQLVVNGSFIANKVLLNRTRGDVTGASAREPSTSSNAAEVFNFGYEAWLKPPGNLPSTTNVYGEYDSIVGLPPVL